MTLWFGLGLIVYVHLLFLVVVYVSYNAFVRIGNRLAALETSREAALENVSKVLGSLEKEFREIGNSVAPEPDRGVVASHAAPQVRQVAEHAGEDSQAPRNAGGTGMPRAEVDFLTKLKRMKKTNARAATI